MKKLVMLFLSLLASVLISCGEDDSALTGLVGRWELSEINFESGNSTASFSDNKLSVFTLEFKADNTLEAKGTSSTQTYAWSYDTETKMLSISFETGDKVFPVSEEGTSFEYIALEVEKMNQVKGDNRQTIELAASTFIQQQQKYDPSTSLNVYFKYERL